MKKLIALLICLGLTACTEQARVKRLGGQVVLNLPVDQKLITATWEGSDLWLLYRTRRADEEPESYFFEERSSWVRCRGALQFLSDDATPETRQILWWGVTSTALVLAYFPH